MADYDYEKVMDAIKIIMIQKYKLFEFGLYIQKLQGYDYEKVIEAVKIILMQEHELYEDGLYILT